MSSNTTTSPNTTQAQPANGTQAKVRSSASLTSTQRNEAEAQAYCKLLVDHITKKKGRFFIDEQGEYSVLIDKHRIPLNLEPDNHAFNRLLLEVCNVTSAATVIAKSTLIRLINVAHAQVGKFKLRKFSAMSDDNKRLYVPLKDSSKVLRVTAEGITPVENGTNEDCFWVEHPNLDPEVEPLDYRADEPKAGLDEFERLIVDNLACRVPGMRWFVAMEEVLFPFVREVCRDRVITHHEGPTGSGKTSGAELPCLLLGLEPTGDTTAPVLNRIGDCGLLVMDNKEQENMKTGFTDFILFLATPTLRARCSGDGYRIGNRHRPVGVLTSIEGAYKAEAIDRLVEVSFNAHERDRAVFNKRALRGEIKQKRHMMLSALMLVLQRFLKIDQEGRAIEVPKELERFGENFRTLAGLLFAYAEVAKMPSDWAEKILDEWKRTIQAREVDGDEMDYFVTKFLRANGDDDLSKAMGAGEISSFIVSCTKATYKEQTGVLTVTTCDQLLDWLQTQDRYNKSIPRNTGGLGKRLRSMRSRSFKVLDDRNAPELPQLKRKNSQRFIGFFEPYGEEELAKQAAAKVAQQAAQAQAGKIKIPLPPKQHAELPSKPKPSPPPEPVATVRPVFQPSSNPAQVKQA